MLFCSMGVSVDGYIADRNGDFGWGRPSDELFAFHTDRIESIGAELLGRRLYETMLVWETDPAMRHDADSTRFADGWAAIPKTVFSRTLTSVEGNARLAERALADEIAAALEALEGTGKDVEIGGADLAGQAIELGLVDELNIFRSPVIVGGGTPLLPPVTSWVQLELVEHRNFDGVLYERYRRTDGNR